MSDFIIYSAGDQAIIAEFGKTIDENVNQKVLWLKAYLERKKPVGVTELLPTYRSLMVFYDSGKTNFRKLEKHLKKIKFQETEEAHNVSRKIYVPCCYGGERGPDLSDMEKALKLSQEEIIKIHSERDYKIYMLGFLPGFVYLGGLDKRICMPRLQTPRTSIPQRSVGIGGDQTGVYPIASPGGWRLIGQTPVPFYEPEKENPVLCKAGDYIRFVPILETEYAAVKQDVRNGCYQPEIEIING